MWKYEKLNIHCDIISGYAFASSDWENDGIPVIKISNISNGSDVILDESTQYVNEAFGEKIDKKYRIESGDILISLTGSHINQPNSMVGRACKNYTDKFFLLNQRAWKLIPFDNTDKNYLFYLFLTKAIKYDIVNRAYGSANQVNVSPKDIKKIKWHFPEISVQRKISGILSNYDEMIQNNNKRINILEQMVEELYKEWFVRFRYPGYESDQIKNGMPQGWNIKRLSDFGRIETGKTPSTADQENYGKEIMFIKTPDMADKTIVIESEEYLSIKGHSTQPKKLLPPNSIMVTCIGSGGIVAINAKEAHTNQQINSIIVKDSMKLEWLLFVCKNLKSTIEMFGSTGTTMTNLSKTKFENLKVVCPTDRLIRMYHDFISPMLTEIKTLMYQNQNLVKQRDLLLPRLMSGKLEVKESE